MISLTQFQMKAKNNSNEAYNIMERIAVPVEKPENFSPISEIFGRSHFFLVHNSTNNLIFFYETRLHLNWIVVELKLQN